MELEKTFGDRLKQIRIDLHLSQLEMALKCDLQQAHIGQLERGVRCPSLNTLYKISSGIKVSISELVNFDEKLVIPHNFDKQTNQIIARVQNMPPQQKKQILSIIKTLNKTE